MSALDYSLADFLVGFGDDPLVPDEDFAQWRQQTAWAGALYEPQLSSAPEPRTTMLVDGQQREVLNLASYNYLGLARHPEVLEASIAALRRYGTGTCGSPMLSGLTDLHKLLESRLAALVGKPEAMLFNSGFGGALGTLAGLLRRDDVAVLDSDSHACLVDGARLAGARVATFAHDDADDLDAVLTENEGARRVVVVEGMYSVFGDVADLGALTTVARRHGVGVMVDEAHSALVLGPNGGGATEALGVGDDVALYYTTFSKAFAGIGSFVAGERDTLDYLRCYANPYVFSCSLPAPVVAGLLAGLDVAETEPERRSTLLENAAWFRRELIGMGLDTGNSSAHVVPIVLGNDRAWLYQICLALREAGLFVAPFDFPSVPEDRLCLRTCVTAAHTRADLEQALDIIAGVIPRRLREETSA